ncbi:MAG: moeB, partial [Ilumatobacteraceae bacterium]|nr:moeB [Ilumatobacteraceae bacterium]
MPTFRDLLSKAKAEITEIDTASAEARIAEARATGAPLTILDVREPDEFDQGALPGVVHIPRGHLEAQVENRIADKSTPVIAYCAGGVRSAFAAKTLQELGYTDVVSMAG